jgi:hypothetical protein
MGSGRPSVGRQVPLQTAGKFLPFLNRGSPPAEILSLVHPAAVVTVLAISARISSW